LNSLIRKTVSLALLLGLTACASQPKTTSDQKSSLDLPKLKRPEVRKLWVPDQIVGDEYITGHWKYLIEKNAVWTKEN
jgi:hypothetical protein